MPLIVQKFGGTSVDGPDRMTAVARRVVETRRSGADVLVVVSAMGQTTDEMQRLAYEINPTPPLRELDMLVTAGERIAMSLLAMAIHAEGESAVSYTGSQSGIITDTSHGNARIRDVRAFRIQEALDRGHVAIVAGYQGVSTEKEVTTLGRGGSDLTAIALAAAFGAERCEMYKDVDGVMTADPRICPDPRPLSEIPLAAMIALARAGSGVLYEEGLHYAREKNVSILVRSSFHPTPGTRITLTDPAPDALYAVSLAAPTPGEVRVAIIGGPDRLQALAETPPLPDLGPCRLEDDLTLVWTAPSFASGLALARRLHTELLAR